MDGFISLVGCFSLLLSQPSWDRTSLGISFLFKAPPPVLLSFLSSVLLLSWLPHEIAGGDSITIGSVVVVVFVFVVAVVCFCPSVDELVKVNLLCDGSLVPRLPLAERLLVLYNLKLNLLSFQKIETV